MNNSNPNMGHFRNAIQRGLLISIPVISLMPAVSHLFLLFHQSHNR